MIHLRSMIATINHVAMLGSFAAFNDRLLGKWIFAGLFGLLILWLLLIPRERLGQRDQIPRWWRNVRIWAIAVASIQLIVYALWG